MKAFDTYVTASPFLKTGENMCLSIEERRRSAEGAVGAALMDFANADVSQVTHKMATKELIVRAGAEQRKHGGPGALARRERLGV